MLKKFLLVACALTVTAASVRAMSHEGGEGGEGHGHMGPPPGLMIPLPPDTEIPPMLEPGDEPPAAEDMAAAFEAAIDALDGDGDGQLGKDEIRAAYDAAMEMMDEPMEEGSCGGCGGAPPMGPPPFPHLLIPADFEPPALEDGPGAMMEAAFNAIDSNGDGKLSKDEIKNAFDTAMDHGDMGGCGAGDGVGGCGGEMGMDPEWPEADCHGATGNEITRQLIGADGENAVAISLPTGREASCFNIDSEADIEVQIIEESDPSSDPAVMWHSDDGEEALADLLLEEGIYHVEVLSADDESTDITVIFVDYPAE